MLKSILVELSCPRVRLTQSSELKSCLLLIRDSRLDLVRLRMDLPIQTLIHTLEQ